MNAAADVPQVVVSIKPLHALVAGVMEGVGTPELLVSGTTSPHDFHWTPSQRRMLQKADLLFYIDPAFETFLQDTLLALPDSVHTRSVVAGAKIALLPQRAGGVWDMHAEHHDHEHNHDLVSSTSDFHVWLDPVRAQRMVTFIAQELSARDPAHQTVYTANAARLHTMLEHLDARIRAKLAGRQQRPFLVFHDAFQYFEQRYHLTAAGAMTLYPEEPPTPHRLMHLRARIAKEDIACVFHEPGLSDRTLRTVVQDTHVRVASLDPEAIALAPGPELYLKLMEATAETFNACLSPKQ